MDQSSPGILCVRRATLADVPRITEIYNEAVRTTVATFDTEPRTVEDRTEWFRNRGRHHPVFVATEHGLVVGWASLSPWSERKAYEATAEVSVYVEAPYRGRGAGTLLLETLVRSGEKAGHHTLIARIADGNEVSLKLHGSQGFGLVGVMREVGRKFGKWRDVHLMQLTYPRSTRSVLSSRPSAGPKSGRKPPVP